MTTTNSKTGLGKIGKGFEYEWVTNAHVPKHLQHFPLSLSKQQVLLRSEDGYFVDVVVGAVCFSMAMKHVEGSIRLVIGHDYDFLATDTVGTHVASFKHNIGDDGLFLVPRTYPKYLTPGHANPPFGVADPQEAFDLWVRSCTVSEGKYPHVVTPTGVMIELQ